MYFVSIGLDLYALELSVNNICAFAFIGDVHNSQLSSMVKFNSVFQSFTGQLSVFRVKEVACYYWQLKTGTRSENVRQNIPLLGTGTRWM